MPREQDLPNEDHIPEPADYGGVEQVDIESQDPGPAFGDDDDD